ncbi:hypothetical protein D3C79_881480 [compost metagenome]
MVAFHRSTLQEGQLPIILAHTECNDLIGRAAVAHIQKAPVRREVQAACRLGRRVLLLGQRQALAFAQGSILDIEHDHFGAHFQRQIGMPPLGIEQQVTRATASWQVDRCGDGRA